MARSIRHVRNNSASNRRGSQRSASNGTAASTADALQRIRSAIPPQVEAPKKRGRKPGSRTKLKQPQRCGKVALKPSGDMQFSYVNFKPSYKYTTQLRVILKREYPGLVEDKDENGALIRKRPALDWADYFLNPNAFGVTCGDRVLEEFWRLFEVTREDQEDADRVLDNYLKKRVRDMMYQARVDCVKEHYRNIGEPLDDIRARPIVLEYEQYFNAKVEWFDDDVWPQLCTYWCSDEFKEKRKLAQECRLGPIDIAQNHGGYRPFIETQQVLKALFGPEKANPINTYAVMKSGIKNVDANGSSGTISSQKAQGRMDNYIAGVRRAASQREEEVLGEMEQNEHQQLNEQNLNAQVLYEVSGGGPRAHGRFAIANGAVRAVDVRAAAKEGSVRPSQSLAREVAHLRRENARLQQDNHEKDSALQQNKVTTELILGLYRDLGKEVPEQALRLLSAAQAIATGSSHVGSASTSGGIVAHGQNVEEQHSTSSIIAADGHNSGDQHGANRVAMEASNQDNPNHASM